MANPWSNHSLLFPHAWSQSTKGYILNKTQQVPKSPLDLKLHSEPYVLAVISQSAVVRSRSAPKRHTPQKSDWANRQTLLLLQNRNQPSIQQLPVSMAGRAPRSCLRLSWPGEQSRNAPPQKDLQNEGTFLNQSLHGLDQPRVALATRQVCLSERATGEQSRGVPDVSELS